MICSDTIVAPATAPGDAGIAVVRISGPRALEVLKQTFKPSLTSCSFQTHHFYHGYLWDKSNRKLDEVMVVYMAAPRTYTTDDVVEINCHGGQQVVRDILKLLLSCGIRLADPGEFTYRAFVNGRLDLSQAEAVAQLIHAKSESSRRLALEQMEGLLSRQIHDFADQLKNILVFIEAWIDFPEEDLPQEDLEKIVAQVASIDNQIALLTGSYPSGRVLADGAAILLVGRPNAGKSSLLNALLGEERAIVTDVPGTTRDFLEEGIVIEGVPVRLFDTAGLRESEDPVEVEGIRRAKDKVGQADLVLLLIDGSRQIDEQDLYAHQACRGSVSFLVQTKVDLDQVADTSFCAFPKHRVSVKSGQGLVELKQSIAEFLIGDYSQTSGSATLTEQRHYDALNGCARALQKAKEALLAEESFEFVAVDIRDSLHHLGAISGETTTDSVLEGIFSQFCIGK